MGHINQKITFYKFLDRFVDVLLCLFSVVLSIYLESLYHNSMFYITNSDSFKLISIPLTIFIALITILVVMYWVWMIKKIRR